MPTPIGHALAGVAAGCLAAAGCERLSRGRREPSAPGRTPGRTAAPDGPFRSAAGFALLAMLPDIDLVFGMHRGISHSLGATLVAAGVAGVLARRRRLRAAGVVAATFASHLLLDWCGADPGTPSGIMALWPWTSEFYVADYQVFLRVCREYWLLDCWLHNGRALVRELLILLPLAAAGALVLRRTRRGPAPSGGNRR